MPEAALAREIGLEYAAIAVVANYAAGRGDSERAVPLDRIEPCWTRPWARAAHHREALRAMIRPVLRMGDPRLGRSPAGRRVQYPGAERAAAGHARHHGAPERRGLAAPQIGVPLRVVIFGVTANPRYPDIEPVPTPSSSTRCLRRSRAKRRRAGKAACRSPGCGAGCRASASSGMRATTSAAGDSSATSKASTRAWCSTRSTTSTASSTRCASAT